MGRVAVGATGAQLGQRLAGGSWECGRDGGSPGLATAVCLDEGAGLLLPRVSDVLVEFTPHRVGPGGCGRRAVVGMAVADPRSGGGPAGSRSGAQALLQSGDVVNGLRL